MFRARQSPMKDKLQALVDAYLAAYQNEDADGCALMFTPDGVLYSPFGPPVTGRAAIAAEHREWFTEREEDKRLEVVEYQRKGEGGHCVLGWSANVPDDQGPGGKRTTSGVSLCVLVHGDDDVLVSRLALVPDPD